MLVDRLIMWVIQFRPWVHQLQSFSCQPRHHHSALPLFAKTIVIKLDNYDDTYLFSFFISHTRADTRLMLCNKRYSRFNYVLEELFVSTFREVPLELFHELVKLLCFIFVDTGFSQCSQTLDSFLIKITFERIQHESLDQGLHLINSIVNPVSLTIWHHLLKVFNRVNWRNLLHNIVLKFKAISFLFEFDPCNVLFFFNLFLLFGCFLLLFPDDVSPVNSLTLLVFVLYVVS